MCVQLDLEVFFKRPKKEGRPPNLHEFWSEEVCFNKDLPKKKTLMFESYNLVDPTRQGAVVFLRLVHKTAI
jgi:hypothetical protein